MTDEDNEILPVIINERIVDPYPYCAEPDMLPQVLCLNGKNQ
jgi:hypothetical protein